MHRVHHPALLELWPGTMPYHRKAFRHLFEQIELGGGGGGLHTLCSFVELLCWPTFGNTRGIGNLFLQLVQGEIPEVVPGGHLHAFLEQMDEFPAAQTAHRENLQHWLGEAHKLIIVPRSVFDMICDDDTEPPLPLAIAELNAGNCNGCAEVTGATSP